MNTNKEFKNNLPCFTLPYSQLHSKPLSLHSDISRLRTQSSTPSSSFISVMFEDVGGLVREPEWREERANISDSPGKEKHEILSSSRKYRCSAKISHFLCQTMYWGAERKY